jgi:hypothetical protein
MQSKIFIPFMVAATLLACGCASQKKFSSPIALSQDCYWDTKARKVVDSLTNDTAVVSLQSGITILAVGDMKYAPCNFPPGFVGKQVVVSGYVLQIMDYERMIATPFKLTKAVAK